MNKVYDVIIAGAGPVGLFLACELALAKCSVLILEKAETSDSALKQIPFGIRGLSAPTIESFDRRGLLDKLEIHKRMKSPHQNSGQGLRRQVGHFAGIPFYEGDIDSSQWKFRFASSTPTNLISEMQEIEVTLTQRAESLGVEIVRGAAISAFREMKVGEANQISVSADRTDYNCKWLVGCDGARSAVRKLGGFEFAGTEPEFTGYTTKIDLADPEKLKHGRVLTSTGLYLQSQPGYVVIQDFDAGAFHGSQAPLTLEHVQEVLRRVSQTDVTIAKLHIATTWTDRARQATTYRKGNVLLAGDAAHIHSPLGGQGLNLGIGDAMNLGWKLAATIQNRAPAGLLETYETERAPIGAQVLDWSRAQVAVMKPNAEARALNAVIRDLLSTRDGATYVAGRVWGVATKLNLGSDHPLVGLSTPNFEFNDGSTIGERLRQGKWLFVEFDQFPHHDLPQSPREQREDLEYIPVKAKDQLGVRAVLVRPDGIIAWAS